MPELKLLFLQMLVILVASAFRIVGQPGVVGEMAAGLLLGPSLLGRVFPAVMNNLFPADGLGPLYALSRAYLRPHLGAKQGDTVPSKTSSARSEPKRRHLQLLATCAPSAAVEGFRLVPQFPADEGGISCRSTCWHS